MTQTCYFCDAAATSREHVPPQCLFPEAKDVPDRTDFRKNLITVPSCELHNSAKSQDDTYLMMVLVSYFRNNRAASNQIGSKVTRAWARDHKLANMVVKSLQQVPVAGELQYAYEIDTDRFNRSLELVAHGLHFHSFGSRAENPYRAVAYPIAQFEGPDANDVNLGRARILAMADQLLTGLPTSGGNKEIFWFQVSPEVEGARVMRMCFYEGFVVVVLSSPTTGTQWLIQTDAASQGSLTQR